ncbi:TrmH family RNA methyltransferase [bacterium]|nr:TrmH family RNA methyltransferase [bacterium]
MVFTTPFPPPAGGSDRSGSALRARMPVFALLDNIRSVWNVGSIFRTADGAGFGGLVLTGMTATPPRPDMEKVALGATQSVPWSYQKDAVAAARALRDTGRPLVVLEQTPQARPWDDFPYPFPHVCVVGHEVHGVDPAIVDLADHVVEIPMAGAKDSLNVAVSFGILAYAVRRAWLAAGCPEGQGTP